jgi:predicted Fe-Mo cluster-binding NifX family protein
MIIANPFADHPKGRGLEVAHWLMGQQVDAVVTPDDIRDKGPGHALGEGAVTIVISQASTLAAAIADASSAGSLTAVPEPLSNPDEFKG